MARIADELIQRIKAEVSLLRVAEGQGHTLTRQGKDYVVSCPFHDDKTPSCVITPANNLFHCFGCGTGGSVIDWVMKTEGVSFRHAVELLKQEHFPHADAVTTPVKHSSVPKLAAPIAPEHDDQTVLQQVIAYYHQTLKQDPDAQAYLQKRGLDDAELIDHFKLGYANRTLGLRLPDKKRKDGAAMRAQLQRIGLYRDTGREHFNGSLVIPVMDSDGVITEVYGRKLLKNLRKGTPKHTYLPGPHKGVFNVQGWTNTAGAGSTGAVNVQGWTNTAGAGSTGAVNVQGWTNTAGAGSTGAVNVDGLRHAEEVILCESLIDALTFWRWGFKHVTCSYGVNGFTDELLQTLIENNTQRVLIAYDRDDAGERGAKEVAETLKKNNIDAYRILFPKGMDANTYAQKMQPAQKALGLVIRKATWLGKGDAPERQLTLTDEVSSFKESDMASPLAASIVDEAKVPEYETNKADEQATPLPQAPLSDIDVQHDAHESFITIGNRRYRVRGLDQNTKGDQLKIQLTVTHADGSDAGADDVQGRTNIAGAGSAGAMHMDKLDLYSSKQRQVFINQASMELAVQDVVIKHDLGRVLTVLEDKQADTHTKADNVGAAVLELSPEDKQAALDFLTDPSLLSRLLSDFTRAGVVGEETNKLAGYLACVSRKLDKPLAVMIQSSSAAGKSSVMESLLAFMPEEERVQYSAMTGQSLFYMGETNLKNKILAISEEEGASNASYALKLLQSEGEVTIASTGKDDSTGNLITKEYTVEGPVMLLMTTTAIDIDEELLNRCMVLTVNESRAQTEAIHAAQRAKRTLQGLQHALAKTQILHLHRNAQRLLKPLHIINPYADQLTFLSDKTRTRRDHEKYLTLIDSIALLHQYQREIKHIEVHGKAVHYIEVSIADIEMANRLAHDILGRTLDELPPQTRKLLNAIQDMVQSACQQQGITQAHFRFSRKRVREVTQWGNTQLKIHIKRLEEMEYLLVHRGGRGQSFEYELLYDGPSDRGHHLMGLIDTETLSTTTSNSVPTKRPTSTQYKGKTAAYDTKKSGVIDDKSGSSRPQVGGVSEATTTPQPLNGLACAASGSCASETASLSV